MTRRRRGSKYFLVIATIAIVVASYEGHRSNRYHPRQQLVNGRKHNGNIANLQEDTMAKLPPLRVPRLRHHRVADWEPYFENADGQSINGSQNVTLHFGATAFLDCRVAMLSGKQVMWLRSNVDWASLLTLGNKTHISDPRYSVSFRYPNNWRLAISGVRREDDGVYVCQVNTHPPRMLLTNVTVLAPSVRIIDEAGHELQERYYRAGSAVELACVARLRCSHCTIPYPVWRTNGQALPGHVNVYHANESHRQLVVTRLYIERARKIDGGEYTCSVSQFGTAAVHIRVLNGEKQAAIHGDPSNAVPTNYQGAFVQLYALLANFLLRACSTYSSSHAYFQLRF